MSDVDNRELRRPVKLFANDRTTVGCPTCKSDVEDTFGSPRIPRCRLAGQASGEVTTETVNVRGFVCEDCGYLLAVGPSNANVDVGQRDESSPWTVVGAVFVDTSKRPIVVPSKQLETAPADGEEVRTDGGTSIAREHVLGATIWAYGGGAARVSPWTSGDDLSRFWRLL
ncbi:hypothetical protein [Haloparvum sp. AD34]